MNQKHPDHRSLTAFGETSTLEEKGGVEKMEMIKTRLIEFLLIFLWPMFSVAELCSFMLWIQNGRIKANEPREQLVKKSQCFLRIQLG